MKKIYGFAALCAAMTLASCSNENEPNQIPTGEMEKCYVSVNIATPAAATRATYVEGSPAETAVNTADFYVFNTSGVYMDKVSYNSFDWKDGSDGIDKVANKILEISKPADDDTAEVGYITCILNGPSITLAATDTYSKFLSTVNDYRKNGDYFVMSNSAYNAAVPGATDDSTYVPYATDVKGKVFSEIAPAQNPANTVNIYVERVAARVDTKEGKDDENTAFASEFTVPGKNEKGEAIEIKVTLDHVGFINAMDKSSIVKSINGVTDANAPAGWADDAYRTHWAAASAGAAKIPLYYDDQTDYVSGSSVAYGATTSQYINENVTDNTTHVVVTGTLTVDGSNVEIYTLMGNGDNTIEAGAKATMCGWLQLDDYKYVKTTQIDANTTQQDVDYVGTTDVEIVPVSGKDYLGILKIKASTKEGYELYKGSNKVTVAEDGSYTFADTDANKKYTALKYGGGKNYYYVEIKPDFTGAKAGIIRNHIYELTFNSIKGLGVPVFDPKSELLIKNLPTPDNGGAKWYFNATINILKWTMYTQGIKFE